jgi:arginine/ornithine transport system substrate-binding protein
VLGPDDGRGGCTHPGAIDRGRGLDVAATFPDVTLTPARRSEEKPMTIAVRGRPFASAWRHAAWCLGMLLLLGSNALAVETKPPKGSQAQDVLRIGVDGRYPPFSTIDKGGKLSGFDVDIARALCERIQAKCELVVMENWAEVLPSVEAGRYDAVVASMSITEERLRRVAFTNKYYQVPAKFVARKGAKVTGPGDLAGKRIGVQGGTTHADFVRSQLGGSARVREFPTLPAALDQLERGELDLVLADSLALQAGFLNSKEGKDYEFVGPAFSNPRFFGMGNGIALPKGRTDLKTRLNQAIAAIRADGTYQKIGQGRWLSPCQGTD